MATKFDSEWFADFYESDSLPNQKITNDPLVVIFEGDRTPLDQGVKNWGGFVRPHVVGECE